MMTVLTLQGRDLKLRLEYKELRRLEESYNGRSFMEIIDVLGKNPSLFDMESLIFIAIQDKDLTRAEFVDLLDAELSDPDSDLSFDQLMSVFMKAVDSSVFMKNLQKQQEAETKKAELKKKKAI